MRIRTDHLVHKFTEMNTNKKSIDKLIKNNFYDYINEQWFKETNIDTNPKYYVEVDDFRIVQNKVYYLTG